MSYTLHIVSKSVLHTLHSVKKCLIDSLSVLSEVGLPGLADAQRQLADPKVRPARARRPDHPTGGMEGGRKSVW